MDELDRLKDAFKSEAPILPRRDAKDAALAAAMRAFDAKNASARQGTGFAARLRIAASAALELLTGKRPMRMTHALAGGASLLVLTLAVMTAANLQYLDALPSRDVQPVGSTGEGLRDLTAAMKGETEELARPAAPQPALDEVQQNAATEVDVLAETEADTFQDRQAVASLPASPPAAMAEAHRSAGAPAPMALQAPGFAADAVAQPGYRDQGRDRFEDIDTNPLKLTAEEPVSTFSIDVDTASYSFVRASLNNGVLPQEDAVRVEELVNYFPYDYPGPDTAEVPFKANVSVLETPWNPATKLVHIGIKGYEIPATERPKSNLVFLIDTSGSMEEPNKLPLLINSLKLLVDGLGPDDTVSIVAYAGSAGTVLEPTKGSDKAKIVAALENLWAGGSTAGAEGIRQAYQLAERNFDAAGVNRVMLATDGDFNVGITDTEELKSFVERQRETGIFLSVLGFGRGNYNDELMQVLAQNGNGSAAYIDTLNEARKVLVEEASSTMFPIAKDVKIQVEFNPAAVSEYRLIGYETRILNREDFNNDRVDAGEIGSGHTVTALYEITPNGSPAELVDDLRYQGPNADGPPPGTAAEVGAGEYGFLKIRYKLPDSDTSRLIETPIRTGEAASATGAREARFAAAVAAFGQILRGGEYTGDFGYDDVIALAQASKGDDEFGYRSEFVNLVRLAKSAAAMERQQP